MLGSLKVKKMATVAMSLPLLLAACDSAIPPHSAQTQLEHSPRHSPVDERALLDKWFTLRTDGTSDLVRDLPEKVHFTAEEGPNRARLIDPPLSEYHVFAGPGQWELSETGELLIKWTNGFSGISIRFEERGGSEWVGSGSTYWDFVLNGIRPSPFSAWLTPVE